MKSKKGNAQYLPNEPHQKSLISCCKRISKFLCNDDKRTLSKIVYAVKTEDTPNAADRSIDGLSVDQKIGINAIAKIKAQYRNGTLTLGDYSVLQKWVKPFVVNVIESGNVVENEFELDLNGLLDAVAEKKFIG